MNATSQRPLVSVIIPTYNRAAMLGAAVRSVFEQTYRPLECVVVDDGSTDDTAEVVRKLAHGSPEGVAFKGIRQEHGGVNRARNRGLSDSSGAFICYLDSDDALPTDSVACRAELLEYPAYGFAYGRTAVRDAAGALLRVMNEPWPEEGEARIARYLFVGSAPLIRRTLSDAVGPWREDDRYGQEYEYFARVKLSAKDAGFTYDVVSDYTRHDGSRLFDNSISFNHAAARMLAAVENLVLSGPKDSLAERRALALEFTKLGRRFHRLCAFAPARAALAEALSLAPTPRRTARYLWSGLCVLLKTPRCLFVKGALPRSIPPVAVSDDQPPSPVPAPRRQEESPGPVDSETTLAWWTGGYNNWGDLVTPFILGALTGGEVRRGHGPSSIYAVGSIIGKVRAGGRLWGAGLLSRKHLPVPFPDDVTVHAVRGPLTRNALLRAGVTVPEVYGDPVLLMPYLLRSDTRPGTGIGIICHYHDAAYLGDVRGTRSHRIIDIQAGLRAVLEAVLDCEAIVSSSLHGLVLAEAYGKQAAWLQVDRGRHLVGRDFKFKDYLSATGRRPLYNRVQQGRDLQLDRLRWLSPPCIDLQPLLDAFPEASGLTLDSLRARDLEEL